MRIVSFLPILIIPMTLASTPAAEKKPNPGLYVTNSAGDNIHVIDLRTFQVIGQISTGDRPHGAAVSADGKRFFTTVEGDHTLRVYDTASNKLLRSIKLSGLPNQCAAT